MKKNTLILFASIAIVAGCNKNKLELYQNAIVKSKIDVNLYHRLLVIPGEGCPGCISSAATFALNDLGYEDSTLVVFTEIHDLRHLKLHVGTALEDCSFAILDIENIFSTPATKSMSPQFWEISDGIVVRIYDF